MSAKTDKPREIPQFEVSKASWVCYWQDDASPVPQIKVERKNVSKAEADAWLRAARVSDTHWLPKIADRNRLKA